MQRNINSWEGAESKCGYVKGCREIVKVWRAYVEVFVASVVVWRAYVKAWIDNVEVWRAYLEAWIASVEVRRDNVEACTGQLLWMCEQLIGRRGYYG